MGRRLADAILISVLRVTMLRAGRRLVGLPRRQLYPQQETISAPLSELPLSANNGPEHLQQGMCTEGLDHLVGAGEQCRGNGKADRLCDLCVHHELDARYLLDRGV